MEYKIKSYLLILLICVVAHINAAANIGTTVLLYDNSNATDVLTSKLHNIKDPKLEVRSVVLAEIVKQMAGFQSLLNRTLTESGAYSVYDARPIVENWQKTNLTLLDTIYKTKSVIVQNNENINQSKVRNPDTSRTVVSIAESTTSVRKFILLGFLDSIHEKENRTPIQGTNKTALIYNLDISCEYRLIDPNNNRIVAVFNGMGHGGIARILGTRQLPVNYDISNIVSDMYNSLAENVLHVLLVRRAEYIKKRDNAARRSYVKAQ
ncbi:MAG: hypothetical protein K0R49_309 [Burkholderiales bacterium]|nr:hypothetical protein [Burkholderiales bacterium]